MAPEVAVSDEQIITAGTSEHVSSAHPPPVVSTLPMMQSSKQMIRRKRRQAATQITLAVGSALYIILVVGTGLETFASDWTILSGGGGREGGPSSTSSSSSPLRADASHLPIGSSNDLFTDSHEHSDSRMLTKKSESSSSSSSERHFHTATQTQDFAAYSCESLHDLTTAHAPPYQRHSMRLRPHLQRRRRHL